MSGQISGQFAKALAEQSATNAFMDLLVKNNIDVNSNIAGTYLIHMATKANRCDVVQLLLLSGADPSKLDVYGESSLVLAAKQNSYDIIGVLVNSLVCGKNNLDLSTAKELKSFNSEPAVVKGDNQNNNNLTHAYDEKEISDKFRNYMLMNAYHGINNKTPRFLSV